MNFRMNMAFVLVTYPFLKNQSIEPVSLLRDTHKDFSYEVNMPQPNWYKGDMFYLYRRDNWGFRYGDIAMPVSIFGTGNFERPQVP